MTEIPNTVQFLLKSPYHPQNLANAEYPPGRFFHLKALGGRLFAGGRLLCKTQQGELHETCTCPVRYHLREYLL